MTDKKKAKTKTALEELQEKVAAMENPRPHFSEALEHLEYVKRAFAEAREKRKQQREKEEEEARAKAEAMIDGEKNPEFKKLLKASTYMKIVSLFQEFDRRNAYNTSLYSDKQLEKLNASIPNKDRAAAYACQNFRNAMVQYSKLLYGVKRDYELAAAKLTRLIDLYESYLADAQVWGNCIKSGAMGVGGGVTFEWGEDEDGRLWADRKAGSGWGTLYLYPDGTTKVDIEGDGRLYSRMVEQAENVSFTLSYFKSYIEALDDLIFSTDVPIFWLTPLTLEELTEYPDYIEEQNQKSKDKYFRFRLNQRKEKGEMITPEEEKWALYPDYNEIEANKEIKEVANGLLLKFLEQWELSKEKLQKVIAEIHPSK